MSFIDGNKDEISLIYMLSIYIVFYSHDDVYISENI